ncbi:unnamed protein product [Nezara viridula]|uniref:Roundabout n=1 Tax=Nezara viridula TaxID=85310 RepID=A0A9P0HCV0_NEZVI|nr:unnamed protein product [Nezara viridula]
MGGSGWEAAVKPFLSKEPRDVTALVDSSVELECAAGGDPPPKVLWRRADGKMPISRARLTEDKSLRIERIAVEDEGVYICDATNLVGTITAKATLTVHSPPTFTVKPEDQTVGLNGVAQFECAARGSPPPSVYWAREGSQLLMFPANSYGRLHVSPQGQLTIHGVLREDAGFLVCSALSVAGSATARAYLEVRSTGDNPPPIVEIGPANQTLPRHSVAILPCQVRGQHVTSWSKDGSTLKITHRHSVFTNGTLQIDDLENTDSGVYTCTAKSDSGESYASGWLRVGGDPERGPEPGALPRAPSSLRLVNASLHALTLAWDPPQGASTLTGYTMEYYSPDLQGGWVVAARGVVGHMVTIKDLKPETRYIFTVRSENAFGLSVPSNMSEILRTLGGEPRGVSQAQLEEARLRLGTRVINLMELSPISSTTVRVTWEILTSDDYIEGVYIRFREVSGGWHKYSLVTVMAAGATHYTVSSLRKFTKYEFFLTPFFKSVEGQPSNSKFVQTLEDVPSAAPLGLSAEILNSTTAQLRWSAPPMQHHNGVITGYKVVIRSNMTLHETVRNTTVPSLLLNKLNPKFGYTVVVTAITRIGSGPFSRELVLSTAATSRARQGHTWLLVLSAACALVLGLSCSAALYLRRRGLAKELGHLSVSGNEVSLLHSNGKETLWIERGGWGKEALGDYAEVDTRGLTTFASRKDQPTPYATTTLLNRRPHQELMPLSETKIEEVDEGNQQMSSIDSGMYYSEEVKPTPKQLGNPGKFNSAGNVANWAEFLPPPPDHPPPHHRARSINQEMCVSPQVSRRCPPPLPPARNYSPAWLESQSVGSDSSKHKHFPPPAQKPPPIPRYNGTNQSQSSSSSSSCPYHQCSRKATHEENASLLYKQPIANDDHCSHSHDKGIQSTLNSRTYCKHDDYSGPCYEDCSASDTGCSCSESSCLYSEANHSEICAN